MRRLNELVALLCVPEPQRGIVKKLVQHAVKLALLHRCFRWAVGEFGDIDADDAQATAAATLFFLSRWLIWRPELRGGHSLLAGTTVGLVSAPGSDPALLALEARLEYGRRFWRDPVKRERLLRHWLDVRHPYSDRLRERWLPLVDRVLRSPPGGDDALDAALQAEGSSLRAVVREIPPVFGSFFNDPGHGRAASSPASPGCCSS